MVLQLRSRLIIDITVLKSLMAKAVLICSRAQGSLKFDERDLERLFSRLRPDNICPRDPWVSECQGVLLGVFNPPTGHCMEGGSICLGVRYNTVENWWIPGEEVPDGSFALFRSDEQVVEVATDLFATRTVWYFHSEDLFIAANSQRAIVYLLGNLEFNHSVIPWLLSSGTLGPGLSWDRRIRCMPGGGCLLLDRRSWELSHSRETVAISSKKLSAKEHQSRLKSALESTLANLSIDDCSKWLLPLSGGYDSRAILLGLKNRRQISTVTWGLRSALNDSTNDASVAAVFAETYGVANEYYHTDTSSEAIEILVDRFLINGEGRVDHLAAYMDGFDIWRRFFEDDCEGVIRGDEAFGCMAVSGDWEVYANMGVKLLEDFHNLEPLLPSLERYQQHIPPELKKQPHERAAAWRDRLSREFEIPYVFAALNDLKLPYVEIISPLLSRKIIDVVNAMPDSMRTDKTLFKKLVMELSPDVPIAKNRAIAFPRDILKTPDFVRMVNTKLSSTSAVARAGIPIELVDYVLRSYENPRHQPLDRVQAVVDKIVSKFTRKILGRRPRQTLDPYTLGFRIYIVVRMIEILESDGVAGVDDRQNQR